MLVWVRSVHEWVHKSVRDKIDTLVSSVGKRLPRMVQDLPAVIIRLSVTVQSTTPLETS